MKKVLGIDVDLTITDSLTPWLEWYKEQTGNIINIKETERVEELMIHHPAPLSFWKKENLYDNLVPFEGAIETLKTLSKEYEIVFVSACFPEHIESKENFLKKYFGDFMSGFISTKEKQFIKMDIFVDDFPKNLTLVKKYQPNCECILFRSPLNSKNNDFVSINSWKEILKIIKLN